MTDDEKDLRRLTRRGFITLGAGAIASYGAWKWLRLRPREAGVEWPLRRALEFNEKLAHRYFSNQHLTATYPQSRITRARINGGLGLSADNDVSEWRLNIEGAERPVTLSLDDVKALPRHTMITELRCIEGWTTIVKWSGARVADVVAAFPPSTGSEFVAMETPDRGYYVGLDMQSAMHPQTLLAYEMNDAPLTWQHGAPLRLAIPVKYGVKNIKRVGTIRYTAIRPADYWAERGYDWYLGL
jgi:DMSO/TMAO reductase YedYZ molybdopterin-dependent catalytic subunit